MINLLLIFVFYLLFILYFFLFFFLFILQDKVIRKRDEAALGSTVNLLSPEGMLTPPASSRKSLDVGTCAISETKPT